MPTASIVFLTPLAALVALAMLLPIAAFVVAERRVATVRRLLALRPPRTGVDVAALAALAAVVALLALAAAQPALSNTRTQLVRTDAEALFVVDTSQSMAASSGRSGATRLERAVVAASRLRAAIPSVPSGVATLTDRVLPNLLPVADSAAFDTTLRNAVAINQPPPREQNVRATSFGALGSIPSAGFFQRSAKRRAIVLLTDGETAPYDASTVATALGANPRTNLVAVQMWRRNEAIYGPTGRADPNYRPDADSKAQLAALANATHGRAFTEGELGSAASSLEAMLGSGPTKTEGRARTTHPLAPYLAALALVPLALIFLRNLGIRSAEPVRGPDPGQITSR
jgi:Ca-activated chloride channel homolog